MLLVGVVLLLAEQSHQTLTVAELLLGSLVQVAGELHENFHLAVLCEVETDSAGRLLHCLCLSRAAHTGYRQSDVYSRALTGVEQVALKEYLTVCDGDYICRDIRGNVARLGLDYREGGHAAAAERVGEVRGTLQQT